MALLRYVLVVFVSTFIEGCIHSRVTKFCFLLGNTHVMLQTAYKEHSQLYEEVSYLEIDGTNIDDLPYFARLLTARSLQAVNLLEVLYELFSSTFHIRKKDLGMRSVASQLVPGLLKGIIIWKWSLVMNDAVLVWSINKTTVKWMQVSRIPFYEKGFSSELDCEDDSEILNLISEKKFPESLGP